MEKHHVKKTGKSQYGHYLLVDDGSEKGAFKGSTEAVNKFLDGKVPCQVEIQETTGEGKAEKISKVRVLDNNAPALGQKDAFRLNVDAGNSVDRAIKLLELGQARNLENGLKQAVLAFYKATDWLEDKKKLEGALPDGKPSDTTGLNEEGVYE